MLLRELSGRFYKLSLLKRVVLGVEVCEKVAGFWMEVEGLVIIVEEVGTLSWLGS